MSGNSMQDRYGKKAAMLRLPIIDPMVDPFVAPPDGGSITCENSYHGDHDEIWFVIREGEKETGRINARYVQSIEWLPE